MSPVEIATLRAYNKLTLCDLSARAKMLLGRTDGREWHIPSYRKESLIISERLDKIMPQLMDCESHMKRIHRPIAFVNTGPSSQERTYQMNGTIHLSIIRSFGYFLK